MLASAVRRMTSDMLGFVTYLRGTAAVLLCPLLEFKVDSRTVEVLELLILGPKY